MRIKTIKEKKEKKEYNNIQDIIIKFIEDVVLFSPTILILGIILMGSYSNLYSIPKESMILNATRNIQIGVNITLTKLIDIGYSKPKTFFFVFFAACFIAFVLPIIILIYRLIKLYKRKKNDSSKKIL